MSQRSDGESVPRDSEGGGDLVVLRLRAVCERTGLARSTVFKLVSSGSFPRPISLTPSGRAVGWIAQSVDEWIRSRPTA